MTQERVFGSGQSVITFRSYHERLIADANPETLVQLTRERQIAQMGIRGKYLDEIQSQDRTQDSFFTSGQCFITFKSYRKRMIADENTETLV